MQVLHKPIYKFNKPNHVHFTGLFVKIDKLILKCTEMQMTLNSQIDYKKWDQSWRTYTTWL